jgi:hypothetical protein
VIEHIYNGASTLIRGLVPDDRCAANASLIASRG